MTLDQFIMPALVLAFVLLFVRAFVEWRAIKAKNEWDEGVLKRLSDLEKRVEFIENQRKRL